VTIDACRDALKAALVYLKHTKAASVVIRLGKDGTPQTVEQNSLLPSKTLPPSPSTAAATHSQALLRAAILQNYAYDKYYHNADKKPFIIPRLAVVDGEGEKIIEGFETVKVRTRCLSH